MSDQGVRDPLAGVNAGVCYDTKSVLLKDKPKGSEVPLMMTAFDSGDNDALDRAGYRGRYVLFALMDGGIRASSTDPYDPEFRNHTFVSDPIHDFMLEVRRGWQSMGQHGAEWSQIEDGGTIVVRESY